MNQFAVPVSRRHALQTAAAALIIGSSAKSLLGLAAHASVEPPTGAGFDARRRWLLESFRDIPISRQPKVGMPQAVARLYLARGRDAEALRYVAESYDQLKTAEAKKGQTRNIAPALVRALHSFGQHFSGQQLGQIRDAVTSQVVVNTLRGHGTENHAAQFVTSMFLLAQFFPNAIWESGDGKRHTSAEMMAEAKSRILQRGRGFFRAGNNEQLSTTYATVNVYPLFNLMEFARDSQVRDAAEAMVLYHLAMLAQGSFDGHIIPPFNRSNVTQQRFGPPGKRTGRIMPMHHNHAWLFWGQNEVIAEDFTKAAEPALALDYVFAEWRMPDVLNHIATGAEAPYEIRGTLPAFGAWGSGEVRETLRYVWRDRDFAIGASPASWWTRDNTCSITTRSASCGNPPTASARYRSCIRIGAATRARTIGREHTRRSSRPAGIATPPSWCSTSRKQTHGGTAPSRSSGLVYGTSTSTS